MKKILLILLITITSNAFGQIKDFNDGPCCDSSGVINDTLWIIQTPYSVKRYQRKNHILINIESYQLAGHKYMTNVHFEGKVKNNTPLIEITDKYAVKLTFGKATENNAKLILIKFDFYVKDDESDCWRLQTLNQGYSIMNFNAQGLGFISFGLPQGAFYIDKGTIKIL